MRKHTIITLGTVGALALLGGLSAPAASAAGTPQENFSQYWSPDCTPNQFVPDPGGQCTSRPEWSLGLSGSYQYGPGYVEYANSSHGTIFNGTNPQATLTVTVAPSHSSGVGDQPPALTFTWTVTDRSGGGCTVWIVAATAEASNPTNPAFKSVKQACTP